MNSFGRIFRVSIFGESHGPLVGVTIDGCPAGLSLSSDDFSPDLARRKGGGEGKTARVEADEPMIQSGMFEGKSTGAPLTICFENKDVDSAPYKDLKDKPRPGHSDMAAAIKYEGFNDYRGGGHFSGRLTVGLVTAGVIAKKLLAPIKIEANLKCAGGSDDVQKAVADAQADGDSVGGIIQCFASSVPSGLGEPFFDSVESLISHIVFAIPGIKGIEFGKGFKAFSMRGSDYNDVIVDSKGHTKTNNCGGIAGGITNGNDLVFRVACRPTASIAKEQETIDLSTGKKTKISVKGRHDACIALRAPVIVEAATAIALADLMMINNSGKQ